MSARQERRFAASGGRFVALGAPLAVIGATPVVVGFVLMASAGVERHARKDRPFAS